MKIVLLVVGKTTEKYFVEAIGEYCKRIDRYATFELEVIPELKNTKSLSEAVQKKKEGEQILRRLQDGDEVVLLDERGREYRSSEFAGYLQQKMNTGRRRLVFVVGGPYGYSDAVYARVPERLSLSRLTFSHQMIRLLFVEQLYRAFSILNNSPYHHE